MLATANTPLLFGPQPTASCLSVPVHWNLLFPLQSLLRPFRPSISHSTSRSRLFSSITVQGCREQWDSSHEHDLNIIYTRSPPQILPGHNSFTITPTEWLVPIRRAAAL